MSYHKDLDEYSEAELWGEIRRRENAREQLLCDYCGRTGDTSPCKFPERHSEAAMALQRQWNLAGGALPPGTYIGGAHMQRPPEAKKTVTKGRKKAAPKKRSKK